MAGVLLRRGFTDLQYEAPSASRPVDFVGRSGARLYRIEVKRLASPEHDELHSTVMRALNTALESDDQPVLISLTLAEAFEAENINPLVRHVKQSLREWREDQLYSFASGEEPLASYKFARSTRGEHARVGIVGDSDMRNVTGIDQGRVLGMVKRAYRKFKILPNDDAVHLVVIEGDNLLHPHSVSEALYGREYLEFDTSGRMARGRYGDGAFSRGHFARVGGVIIARRVAQRLFVPYRFSLFPNPGAAPPLNDVIHALAVDEVLGPNDYP